MVRRCWINFQCQGVLLYTSLLVGQRPIVFSVGAGGGCFDIFSLIYHFSFLSPSLWETARDRLKYCLKGPLSLKQPTNQSKKTKEGLQSILYRVSQNRFSVRHPIQSEKYGDTKSYVEMLNRLVLPRTLRTITLNKSLNILFIYIKKG